MNNRPRCAGGAARSFTLAAISLAALLHSGATLASQPSCGQLMNETFTEFWGLPQGEDRYTADLEPLIARCDSGEVQRQEQEAEQCCFDKQPNNAWHPDKPAFHECTLERR